MYNTLAQLYSFMLYIHMMCILCVCSFMYVAVILTWKKPIWESLIWTVFFFLSEIEARNVCQWLFAAGFPQYVQMFQGQCSSAAAELSRELQQLIRDLRDVCCSS